METRVAFCASSREPKRHVWYSANNPDHASAERAQVPQEGTIDMDMCHTLERRFSVRELVDQHSQPPKVHSL